MLLKPIVVVGSLNCDLIATVDKLALPGETLTGSNFQSLPGGKGANQAAAAARLGHPVYMIGRVGSDTFAGELRESLERTGADTTFVATSEGASGVALIAVSSTGQNSIIIVPGANALLTPEDLDANIDVIRGAAMVLTQLESPLETVCRLAEICATEDVPLILDPAPARQLPREILSRVTWITPNEVEAQQLTGVDAPPQTEEEVCAVAEALLAAGPKNVILKRGEHGAYLATADGFRGAVPVFDVRAVDTTGAGDAFNGAFAVALARGAAPLAAAEFASAAAAISVTRSGALPAMPTQQELDTFVEKMAGEDCNLAQASPAVGL